MTSLKNIENEEEFENEARRYLKSRFRETINDIRRLGDDNGQRKDIFIMEKAAEHTRRHTDAQSVINEPMPEEALV